MQTESFCVIASNLEISHDNMCCCNIIVNKTIQEAIDILKLEFLKILKCNNGIDEDIELFSELDESNYYILDNSKDNTSSVVYEIISVIETNYLDFSVKLLRKINFEVD